MTDLTLFLPGGAADYAPHLSSILKGAPVCGKNGRAPRGLPIAAIRGKLRFCFSSRGSDDGRPTICRRKARRELADVYMRVIGA
jgi:hypothetical protein